MCPVDFCFQKYYFQKNYQKKKKKIDQENSQKKMSFLKSLLHKYESVPSWCRLTSLHLVLLQQLASDDQPLNFTGPFVDFRDASVAVVPLGRHVGHVTHPAQDLDGLKQAEQTVWEVNRRLQQ